MEASTMITIELDRYEELIRLEDRVNTVVGMIARDNYVDRKDILAVLGTNFSLGLMSEIWEKEAKQDRECMERIPLDEERGV